MNRLQLATFYFLSYLAVKSWKSGCKLKSVKHALTNYIIYLKIFTNYKTRFQIVAPSTDLEKTVYRRYWEQKTKIEYVDTWNEQTEKVTSFLTTWVMWSQNKILYMKKLTNMSWKETVYFVLQHVFKCKTKKKQILKKYIL